MHSNLDLLYFTPDRSTLDRYTSASMNVWDRQCSLDICSPHPAPAFVIMGASGGPCRLTLELLSSVCSGLCMWGDETEHGTTQDRSADNRTGTAANSDSESSRGAGAGHADAAAVQSILQFGHGPRVPGATRHCRDGPHNNTQAYWPATVILDVLRRGHDAANSLNACVSAWHQNLCMNAPAAVCTLHSNESI